MADNVKRDFAMSYADLIGVCNTIHSCMIRDASQFLGYGVTNILTTGYKSKIDEFSDLPTDSELASDVGIAYEAKNEAANNLRIMLRSFNTRAKVVFGEKSNKYEKFNVRELSKLNDNDLKGFADKVVRSATELLTELASAGVTQNLIDDLSDMLITYENAVIAVEDAIMLRDDASNNRIKKANEIYKLLTNYCEIGKTIWYETNEARYNDYIIYSSPSAPSLPAPSGIIFQLSNMTLRWTAISEATSYAAEISVNSGTFEEVFNSSANQFTFQPSEDGHFEVRIRARNSAGFSSYSSVYSFDYYAVLPPVENLAISLVGGSGTMFHLTYSAVPSANVYKIYSSVVNIGYPAGEYSFLGESSSLIYENNLVAGKRNWLIMKSANDVQISGWSESVFLDA